MLKTTRNVNRPIVSYIRVTSDMLDKTTHYLNRPILFYIRVPLSMLKATPYLNRLILSYIYTRDVKHVKYNKTFFK